ncbi:MAG: hypothetical protein IIW57_01040, partial [Lachnospiraceae bacterium]|nr:hypothetical protein [Lachnospiraceae bacterium]
RPLPPQLAFWGQEIGEKRLFSPKSLFFIAFQHFFGLYRLPCKMYMVHEIDRYVPEICTKK